MFALIKHALSMRRMQSVATLVSVVLSVGVAFVLVLAFVGVQGGLETSKQRLGADLMIVPADAAVDLDQNALLFTGAPANMYMKADVVQQIAGISGVERVTEQFFGQTLNASCCSASEPARLVGYDAATDWVIKPWTSASVEGSLGQNEVVVGSNLCADYASHGKVLGRTVDMVAGLDETGTDLDGSILMDIDQVRAFVKDTPELAYLWDEYGDPSNLVSCVLVDVQDGARDVVIARLSEIPGIAVIEAAATVETVSEQLGSVFSMMAFVAILLVVVALFQLFARFFSLAWDRRSELALYRALGASRKDIAMLIGGEAAVLIGGGIAGGLVLGGLLFVAVPSILVSAGSFPFKAPDVGTIALAAIGCIALFIVVGASAIAWPLARAGRIDPSSAMQTGDID